MRRYLNRNWLRTRLLLSKTQIHAPQDCHLLRCIGWRPCLILDSMSGSSCLGEQQSKSCYLYLRRSSALTSKRDVSPKLISAIRGELFKSPSYELPSSTTNERPLCKSLLRSGQRSTHHRAVCRGSSDLSANEIPHGRLLRQCRYPWIRPFESSNSDLHPAKDPA